MGMVTQTHTSIFMEIWGELRDGHDYPNTRFRLHRDEKFDATLVFYVKLHFAPDDAKYTTIKLFVEEGSFTHQPPALTPASRLMRENLSGGRIILYY